MTQIEEDYVSFDLAKLLKEKGFNIECTTAYFNGGLVDYTMFGFCDGELIPAPTLSLACKWLRLKHNLFIEVGFGKDYIGETLYLADIYNLTHKAIEGIYEPIIKADYYLTINPKSPEEAMSEALKYCLEHLI